MWECNLLPKDVGELISRDKSPFWHDVMYAWSKVCEGANVTRNRKLIWFNSEIRINNKPFLWIKALQNGLMTIDQLYSNGKLRAAKEILEEFGLTLLELNSIISATPRAIKEMCLQNFCMSGIKSATAYQRLCMEEFAMSSKHRDWERELKIEINFDLFIQGFADIYRVTNITKYRSFQYRLLHRAIITNSHLYRWGRPKLTIVHFVEKTRSRTHIYSSIVSMQKNYGWNVRNL